MSDVISEMLVGAVGPKTRPIRSTAALPGFYRAGTLRLSSTVLYLHTNTWLFDDIVVFELQEVTCPPFNPPEKGGVKFSHKWQIQTHS